jgi:hypothetical protein
MDDSCYGVVNILACTVTKNTGTILGVSKEDFIDTRARNLLHGTPWSRVLPEKLKRPKLLKKFPAFYKTRRFITVFTRDRHLSLS